MRVHRFYVQKVKLDHDFWLQDEPLIHQWHKVLRYKPGQEVVLFDGVNHDRLYKIIEFTPREAHLAHVTDFERKIPAKDIYLFWSLLKKDKNDWVLQKCTELGISHFVPILAERSEKTGFNLERAQKILIEAAEQCGRSDIPSVREPLHIEPVLNEYSDKIELFICEQGTDEPDLSALDEAGVFIGPEGGWSDKEKKLFKDRQVKHLHLHDFTLRAETAAITAITKLIR